MENINKDMLHRAFSVFLFNSEGKLLLQKRSATKITFPDYWTNTCCSHPLSTPLELEQENQLGMSFQTLFHFDLIIFLGVRRAARRKLEDELGISPDSFELDEFKYLTRLHYKAPSDGLWGEHEIDYILFLQKDIPFVPNAEEVSEVKYVSQDELRSIIEEGEKGNLLVTPWFRLIVNNFLWKWWDALLSDTLKEHEDFDTIHKF